MKVIDLLNRIANGEEMPSPIYHNGLYYDFEDGDYFNQENISWLFNDNDINTILNDTVEILEKKIPKKLYIRERANDILIGKSEKICYATSSLVNKEIANKINEIIDYLDYLISKGK